MHQLSLSLCLSRSPMSMPLLDGRVAPQGVDLIASAVHPSEMFWRQLKYGDFDISEMSLSSLLIAAAQGQHHWTAIPVFPTRRFFHTGVVVRAGTGIKRPEDLAGCRIGVPEYQQTAAVWVRGALEHEFGVAPKDMRWFMERPPHRSHGGATGFHAPPGVEIEYIDASRTIGSMLADGDLDAAALYLSDRNLVDRTSESMDVVVGVHPLFPDPLAEARRYQAATGLLPVNHTVVIRTALLERHPWLALNVYSAFLAAKETVRAQLVTPPGEIGQMTGLLEPWLQVGAVSEATLAAVATVDPAPYGIRDQRLVLDTLTEYLTEQGLLPAGQDPLAVFAPSTRDL